MTIQSVVSAAVQLWMASEEGAVAVVAGAGGVCCKVSYGQTAIVAPDGSVHIIERKVADDRDAFSAKMAEILGAATGRDRLSHHAAVSVAELDVVSLIAAHEIDDIMVQGWKARAQRTAAIQLAVYRAIKKVVGDRT